MVQGIDQREHYRFPVAVSCEIVIRGEAMDAETRNLSTGGAAILADVSFVIGEVITVSFFLTQDGIEDPESAPFESSATVRWTEAADDDEHLAGVQFVAPSDSQKKQLTEFLEQTPDS